ncbi:MAG TPA: HAD family phosphatase [Methylomirabilota bacterium]|nr:HAD family phosphatase [Methylomirabilota bacterium]
MTAAALFDMDGVLIDSGAHHRQAWRMLLAELGAAPADPEHWRLTIGRPSEEAISLLLGRRVSDAEARRLARRKRDFYQERVQSGLDPVPGVRAFLESLERGGVPCAVGTSASRWDAERLLDDLGLLRFFDVMVTADDVILGKPDPEVWLQVARRLRVPAARCVVFEDAPVGIRAAVAAGMRAIGVTTAHRADELVAAGAERTIDDFQGLEWSRIAPA